MADTSLDKQMHYDGKLIIGNQIFRISHWRQETHWGGGSATVTFTPNSLPKLSVGTAVQMRVGYEEDGVEAAVTWQHWILSSVTFNSHGEVEMDLAKY